MIDAAPEPSVLTSVYLPNVLDWNGLTWLTRLELFGHTDNRYSVIRRAVPAWEGETAPLCVNARLAFSVLLARVACSCAICAKLRAHAAQFASS